MTWRSLHQALPSHGLVGGALFASAHPLAEACAPAGCTDLASCSKQAEQVGVKPVASRQDELMSGKQRSNGYDVLHCLPTATRKLQASSLRLQGIVGHQLIASQLRPAEARDSIKTGSMYSCTCLA